MKEECFAHGVVVQLNQWYEDGTPQVIEHYKNTFLNNGEYHNPFNVVESRVTDGHGTRTLRPMKENCYTETASKMAS